MRSLPRSALALAVLLTTVCACGRAATDLASAGSGGRASEPDGGATAGGSGGQGGQSGGASGASGGAIGGSGSAQGLAPACPTITDPEVASAIRELRSLPTDAPLDPFNAAQIANLTGEGVESLDGFSCLSNLANLTIQESPGLVDLSPLQDMPNVKSVLLRGVNVSDYRPLGTLDLLSVVSITDSPLTDLTVFASILRLELLSLAGTEVSDLSPLMNHPSLRSLTIVRSRVESLEPLLAGTVGPGLLALQNNPLSASVFSEQIPKLVSAGWCILTGEGGETLEHPPGCNEPDKP